MASENIPIVYDDGAGAAYLPKRSLSLRYAGSGSAVITLVQQAQKHENP